MLLRIRQFFAFCLVVASIITYTLPSCKADIIDVTARQQDARLEKTVSLSEPRLPLKAVLDRFAAQTGITLTIDERDPSSGYPLMVECSQVPVGKMMNALYSLFSVQGGEWTWEREGKPGAYTYAFHETLRAKHRTDAYHHVINKMLDNYLALLGQLAPMKMEQRKAYREALKKALHVDDEAWMDSFFDTEGFWNQANFFLNALTLQQQEDVLHGISVSVSLKTLSPAVYDFYHQNYLQQFPLGQIINGISIPEPENVEFLRVDPNQSHDDLSYRVDIVEGKSRISWMATGHLEIGIRDALKHIWLLAGDRMTDPASETVVKEPKETEAIRQEKAKEKADEDRIRNILERNPQHPPFRSPGSHLRLCLEQMAQGNSMPLLALLPGDEQDQYSTPIGKPVQAFLDHLEGNYKSYFYKWREGVLLVNYPYWFTQPVPYLSYSLLRSLHPDKAGRIPVPEWAELMHTISDDQAQWFAVNQNISNLKDLRPCLLFIAAFPRVLKPEGDSVDRETIERLQSLSVLRSVVRLTEATTRLRIREEKVNDLPPLASWLHIEGYNPEKRKWERLNGVALPFCENLLAREPEPAPNAATK